GGGRGGGRPASLSTRKTQRLHQAPPASASPHVARMLSTGLGIRAEPGHRRRGYLLRRSRFAWVLTVRRVVLSLAIALVIGLPMAQVIYSGSINDELSKTTTTRIH